MGNIYGQISAEWQAKSTMFFLGWILTVMTAIAIAYGLEALDESTVPASKISEIKEGSCLRSAVKQHFLNSKETPITRKLLGQYEDSCARLTKYAKALEESQSAADAQRNAIETYWKN